MFILVIFQSLEATYILKTHVQGVINHGQNRFFPFIDINEYCHDANLVVNTVLKVLKESIGKASTEISLYSFRCWVVHVIIYLTNLVIALSLKRN